MHPFFFDRLFAVIVPSFSVFLNLKSILRNYKFAELIRLRLTNLARDGVVTIELRLGNRDMIDFKCDIFTLPLLCHLCFKILLNKRFATIKTYSPEYGEETNNHIRNCQVNKQKVHSCSHAFIFKYNKTDE